MGIITELVRKSKKSRNCISDDLHSSQRAVAQTKKELPRAIMITPTMTVAFFRLQPSSSWKVETALSVRAMELVSAAHSTSRKNRIPTKVTKSHAGKDLRNRNKHQRRSRLQLVRIPAGKSEILPE